MPPSLVTVTWAVPDASLGALTGTQTFAPVAILAGATVATPIAVTDATDQLIIAPAGVTRQLGVGVVELVPTDNVNLSPAGWMYLVTTAITGLSVTSQTYLIPHSPSPVDLSALVPAVAVEAVSPYATAAALEAETARAEAVEATLTPLGDLPLGIPLGGTGGTTAATARTSLGLGSAATQSSAAFDAAGSASTAQATAETFATAAAASAQGTAETFATSAVGSETTRAAAAEALKAPLASPALTGTPTAPTQTTGDSTTKLATDAFVATAVGVETTRATSAEGTNASAITAETSRATTAEGLLAPKASPALTGTPTAPTAAALTSTTQLATTAYTDTAVAVEATRATTAEALALPKTGGTLTGPVVGQVPNIVFDGDSLTNGTGALPFNNFPLGNDYPSQVAASLDHRGTYYNVGVGGEQVAGMITNAPAVVDAKLVSGANNVVCFAGGTNDLQSTDNATTTYNRIVAYCQARQAAGWKVIVSTLTPRADAGTPGDFETVRQTVNSSIRANWATFANALADVGNDAAIGAASAYTDTRYYNGDLVHHNPNGYRIRAGYVLSALDTLGIRGHQHGDLSGLASDMFIPAGQFSLSSGTPTAGVDNLWPCWHMHHGETDAVAGGVILPRDWLSYSVDIVWANTAGGSGNVAWRLDPMSLYSGSATTSVTAGGQTNVAVAAGSIVVVTFPSGGTYTANQAGAPRVIQGFRVVRLGTSGSDTYASDADLIGLYLYRVT